MIVSDTGWKHDQPYRCTSRSNRTVLFSPDTPDEEIEAKKAELEKGLPGGQERWVKRVDTSHGPTLKAYAFCDSSD